MLSKEDNERVTRVGPGTQMGALMRRYWTPALLSSEIAEPDSPPVRVSLLGERLVAFRVAPGVWGTLQPSSPYDGRHTTPNLTAVWLPVATSCTGLTEAT